MVKLFAEAKRLWVIKINCDLCGKIDERLLRALIENVELNVCSACSKFGKALDHTKSNAVKEPVRKAGNRDEKIELLADNYAITVKKGRESMGLTQKDFASMISEKESAIHKIEAGILEPQLSLARKLEKVLGVKLIEEYHEEPGTLKRKKEEGFRLGDFIKIK